MLKNQTENTSPTWLVLVAIFSMLILFNAGFDHDVVYYGVFIMTSFLGLCLIKYKGLIKVNKSLCLFGIFILWSFISLIWSVSPVRTVIEGIQLLSFFLIYLLTRQLTEEALDKLVRILLLVTGGVALLGIGEYLFISGYRIQATFTNPNPFGIFMGMMFLLSLSLVFRRKSKAYIAISILLLSAVLLTGSRAAIGAMLVSVGLTFIGLKKQELKTAFLRLLFISLCAYGLSTGFMYASDFIREATRPDQSFMASITRPSSFVKSSLVGRLEFWRVAFDLFKNKPLVGYGQGTFFQAYYLEYGMNEWYARFTHNHYLQIAAELGLIGIISFLGFLWVSLKSVVFTAPKSDKPTFFWGMVAAQLAFLLHIGVDFTWNFPAVTSLFFFFLAVTTKEEVCSPLKVSKKVGVLGLLGLLLLTGWQFSSVKLYMKALEVEKEISVDRALEWTQKINAYYPISSYGFSYESELYYKKYEKTQSSEDLKASFSAMNKAINLAPYDSGLHSKMAFLYKKTDAFENAEKYYLKANQYSAYVLNSFIDLGQMYFELGEREKAENILLKALKRAPYALKTAPNGEVEPTLDTIAILHLTLANFYETSGEKAKVQEQVDQLLALKKDYPYLEKFFK